MARSLNVLEVKKRQVRAQQWADEAYVLARRMQPGITEQVKTDEHGRVTFLTEADLAVEKLLVGHIRETFPEDAIIGEEGADNPVTPGCFCWVLDPIDGTDNYARRLQPWAVSIGVLYDGLPVVAAVAVHDTSLSAELRVLTTASHDYGVYLGNSQWTLPHERPANRRIIGMEGLKKIRGGGQLAEQIWAFAHQPRTLSSFIGQTAFVLLGHIDAHLEGYAGLWDLAAIELLCLKAGLKCTRWDGSPVFPHAWEVAMKDLPAYRKNYGQFDVVVGYPNVHAQLLEILGPYAGQVERQAAEALKK